MARAIWQKTVIDNTGAPSNGAQITVTIQGGGAATIFSAQAGGSARSNPFTTGTDGIARFYAERGYYNVSVFKDGSTVSFPWNNLGDKNLFDDLGTAGLANLTTSATDATAGRVFKVGDNVGITFGTNSNGSFTLFPDGTQVCRQTLAKELFITTTPLSSAAQGINIFRSASVQWTFPSSFNSSDVNINVTPETNLEGTRLLFPRFNGVNNLFAGQVQLLGLTGFNTGDGSYESLDSVSITAIGRWK